MYVVYMYLKLPYYPSINRITSYNILLVSPIFRYRISWIYLLYFNARQNLTIPIRGQASLHGISQKPEARGTKEWELDIPSHGGCLTEVSINRGTPKSSIFMGFSIINHVGGTPMTMETPISSFLF